MFWPFAKRGTRVDSVADAVIPIHFPTDLTPFGVNDACIKLWLPEKLIRGLDTLGGAHEMSRPDVLRWLLFEHVYGRPALERLKQWKSQQDVEAAPRRSVGTGIQASPKQLPPSPRAITSQLLGKSVEDCKLYLPSPLKVELKNIAKAEGLGLSDYLRKTLVRILLGESFHHRWQAAIGKLPAEVRIFEEEGI